MLMIPLTFLFALPLLGLAVWLGTRYWQTAQAPWLVAFLALLAVHLGLIGVRYGYDVDSLLYVRPYTGVMVPPLAWLAFRNPKPAPGLLLHLLPLVGMWLLATLAPHFIDSFLAAITFGYALFLVGWGAKDPAALSWAPLRHGPALRWGLWASVTTLVLSGATDAIIALDLFATGGANTESIAAGASLLASALVLFALWFLWRAKRPNASSSCSAQDRALLEALTAALDRDALFRDPNLTLARLARRLGVSARQLSEAVNRTTGRNVSQFLNERRIQAVCRALAESDAQITTIMLDAGFLTKSNFNREFRRVTGKTPTAWRKEQRDQRRKREPDGRATLQSRMMQ